MAEINVYSKTLGAPFLVMGKKQQQTRSTKKPSFVNRMRAMIRSGANLSAVGAGAGPAYTEELVPKKRVNLPENVGAHIMSFVTGKEGSLWQQQLEIELEELRERVLDKKDNLEDLRWDVHRFYDDEEMHAAIHQAGEDYETDLLKYRRLLKALNRPNNDEVYLNGYERPGTKSYYNAMNKEAGNAGFVEPPVIVDTTKKRALQKEKQALWEKIKEKQEAGISMKTSYIYEKLLRKFAIVQKKLEFLENPTNELAAEIEALEAEQARVENLEKKLLRKVLEGGRRTTRRVSSKYKFQNRKSRRK